jgi:hypothetical protein
MNRSYVLASGLLLGLLGQPACAADAGEKKTAELKWAKGVAVDFFDAAFSGQFEQAESMIDSSLKASFAKEGERRLREWLNNSIAIQGFRAPVFQSETIAPDQDEASFQGTFQAKNFSSPEKEKSFTFSLRVVKDKESSKWRVCYFRFSERNQKPK